jgi:hypothetical protein
MRVNVAPDGCEGCDMNNIGVVPPLHLCLFEIEVAVASTLCAHTVAWHSSQASGNQSPLLAPLQLMANLQNRQYKTNNSSR